MDKPGERRNPKDSMVSTWRTDRTQWGPAHYIFDLVNVYPTDLDREVPVFNKSDPVPYLTQWSCHRWILTHALYPMAVQWIYYYLTGGKLLHPLAAMLLYSLAFQANAIHHIKVLTRIGHKYGFLDGDKHARDAIPDHAVPKVLASLELTIHVRSVFAIFLSYQESTPSISWWFPLELALYSVILDGWFYLYHRSCHELDSLWRYHRTHHLTKHPIPTLSAYSDSEQEILEIAIIPLLTYVCLKLMGFPMGFYDWWLCTQYLIFSEVFGHSGLRVYWNTTSTADLFLRPFGCELVVEDHDLHHRKGWRTSYNYGKQSRLWDRLFGTCAPRIECDKSNLGETFNMPLY